MTYSQHLKSITPKATSIPKDTTLEETPRTMKLTTSKRRGKNHEESYNATKIKAKVNRKWGNSTLLEAALPFIGRDRIMKEVQVMLRCKKVPKKAKHLLRSAFNKGKGECVGKERYVRDKGYVVEGVCWEKGKGVIARKKYVGEWINRRRNAHHPDKSGKWIIRE
ncbi:6496_t:CDS:2 [Dentiscutata heterogama]|uniref:6496_t:CDS:1 n=1 Tax=Dentiscutata heterogama TaxID=1316150 RepID=A0ACA9L0N8_9GLOM|nr:6496_t:CDS:2 [Dentiscutata heterogama]